MFKMIKTDQGYKIILYKKTYFFKFSNVTEELYKIYLRSKDKSKVKGDK